MHDLSDVRWKHRINLYHLLNHSWQHYPPIFPFASIRSGPASNFYNFSRDSNSKGARMVDECAQSTSVLGLAGITDERIV